MRQIDMRKSDYVSQFEAEVFGAAPERARPQAALTPPVTQQAKARMRLAKESLAQEGRAAGGSDGSGDRRSIFDASYAPLGFGHHNN
jgi:hypothetical protein